LLLILPQQIVIVGGNYNRFTKTATFGAAVPHRWAKY